jgi:hypothetical protein
MRTINPKQVVKYENNNKSIFTSKMTIRHPSTAGLGVASPLITSSHPHIITIHWQQLSIPPVSKTSNRSSAIRTKN